MAFTRFNTKDAMLTEIQAAIDAVIATATALAATVAALSATVAGIVSYVDPFTYIKIGADAGTVSTTAVTTGLTFAPAANLQYEIEGLLLVNDASAAQPVKVAIAFPTGLNTGVFTFEGITIEVEEDTVSSGLISVGNVGSTSKTYALPFRGTIVTGGAPSGNLDIQIASSSGAVTVTVKAGSFLKYRTI